VNMRESLDELAEKMDTTEFENKALRFQCLQQAQMITALKDEIHFLKRFRQLVERAAEIVGNIPKMKEGILFLNKIE